MRNPSFSQQLLAWFDQHGRKDLPWQKSINHYRVWVSEVMLQQTQVTTVIPYFERFMARFPSLEVLAQAHQDEVLAHWSGLGYYSRGRNLHKAAQRLVAEFFGQFPQDLATLMTLPGLGRSTASAILAIVDQQPLAILDGNVKRVLARYAEISGWPGQPAVANQLWAVAEQLLPAQRIADYTQAMMDLGAMVCTRSKPKCQQCPIASQCQAYQNKRIAAYPGKKPKQEKPEKQAYFLCVTNDKGQVLLNKRPDKGVWGGLWCFPMVDDSEGVNRWCQNAVPKNIVISTLKGARQKHVFTHFTLFYTPVYVSVASNLPDCAGLGRWVDLAAVEDLGLAAPVKRLCQELVRLDQGKCI